MASRGDLQMSKLFIDCFSSTAKDGTRERPMRLNLLEVGLVYSEEGQTIAVPPTGAVLIDLTVEEAERQIEAAYRSLRM
jgi:hypothetical protein